MNLVKPQNESLYLLEGKTTEERLSHSSPYIKLFRECLETAKKLSASDVHIEPQGKKLTIRFRISGILQKWKELSGEHVKSFSSEIKGICNLSIAISGMTQDARVSLPTWGLNLRVSLIPSQFGEKIVLRLLNLEKSFDLEKTGLSNHAISALREVTTLENGLILISGPTGSGKTTTLYSVLSGLDREKLNVTTLEDPIEYTFDGLTQVEITPKLSFAGALRSVLRQDPDVILVGEIRDHETADLALRAAQTGHLVLSTVHANNSLDVVNRLLGLGVDRDLLSQSLRFISAQRLFQKLCIDCKCPVDEEGLLRLRQNMKGINFETPFTKSNDGCSSCHGIAPGRVPILEYAFGEELKNILKKPEKIFSIEIKNSLKTQILELSSKGVVDANEILFVA